MPKTDAQPSGDMNNPLRFRLNWRGDEARYTVSKPVDSMEVVCAADHDLLKAHCASLEQQLDMITRPNSAPENSQ